MNFQRIKIVWVALLLLLAAPVHAQGFLDMAVTPGAQTGLAGTQQFWGVTLFNNTGSAVDITLTGFLSGFPATSEIDVTTGLLPSGAIHLADGQSVAFSSLIVTSIQPAATEEVYNALAELTYDETDNFGFIYSDLTASADWHLTVTPRAASSAPEPTSLALLLAPLVLGLRQRRKRKQQKENLSGASERIAPERFYLLYVFPVVTGSSR